jgi:hypothetical protein
MTARSEAMKREWIRDIECYTCGQQPSPLVMLRAPKLKRWSAQIK